MQCSHSISPRNPLRRLVLGPPRSRWIYILACLIPAAAVVFYHESIACCDELLTTVRTAARESRDGIPRAICSGRISAWDETGQMTENAAFSLEFDLDRFLLSLTYDPIDGRDPRYTRRVIVCDGSALLSNTWSPRIRPAGCEAELFEARANSLASATQGFVYWKPAKTAVLLAWDVLLDRDFDVKQTGNNEIRGTGTPWPNTEVVFVARRDMGCNVATICSRRRVGEMIYECRYSADWARIGKHWYPKRVVLEHLKNDGLRRKSEISYENFKLQQALPDDYFTLQKAKLCAGSRIISRLDNVPTGILHVPSAPQRSEARQGNLAQPVQSLLAEGEQAGCVQ